MFVEKLTFIQIRKIIGTSAMVINKTQVHKDADGQDCIGITFGVPVCASEQIRKPMRKLCDFEGSDVDDEKSYRKAMLSLFGDDYKVAYAAYLDRKKDRKLLELKCVPITQKMVNDLNGMLAQNNAIFRLCMENMPEPYCADSPWVKVVPACDYGLEPGWTAINISSETINMIISFFASRGITVHCNNNGSIYWAATD